MQIRSRSQSSPLLIAAALACVSVSFSGCTKESQNKISRSVQNWTGTNGVLDVINSGKLMYRFINIDKLTTGSATGGEESRAYRYGYGVLDTNQNYIADPGEKKLYFEISDYSTSYIFYENPL
ncbi:MAG: hypothetical protein H7249_11365 [Chitinophagaceae bacterium]|nr:hypothetical protein [Oligoflexus sp.]